MLMERSWQREGDDVLVSVKELFARNPFAQGRGLALTVRVTAVGGRKAYRWAHM